MKAKFLLLFFLFNSLVFCQISTISGTITGFKDSTKVWLGDTDLGNIIEKTTVKNGSFILTNKYRISPKRYYLFMITDSTRYVINFFAENNSIQINGDIKDLPDNLKITGSKYFDDKLLLDKKIEPFKTKIDSINKIIIAKKKDTITFSKSNINKDRENRSLIEKNILNEELNYIKLNPNSLISLLNLYSNKDIFDKKYLKKYYLNLKNDLKKSDYGVNLKTLIETKKILQEGDKSQDFTANDINGKKHNLSDYKGKIIIIDFTQTFCHGCVEAVAGLKDFEIKYKDKIKIISFCGDKSEKTWREGIEKQKQNYLSIWDGNGLFGKVQENYGIKATPTFVIIDSTGKISKKIIGFEKDEITSQIEELINKT